MDTQLQPYTPQQIAALLNVHVRTIHRWCKSGRLEHILINQTYRIPVAALAAVTRPASTTATQSRRPTDHPPQSVIDAATQHNGTPVYRGGQWFIRRQKPTGGDHATD